MAQGKNFPHRLICLFLELPHLSASPTCPPSKRAGLDSTNPCPALHPFLMNQPQEPENFFSSPSTPFCLPS